jgi:adenylate cyclase
MNPRSAPGRLPSARGALKQVLATESWRNERLLNVFRASIWTCIGLITGGSEILLKRSISPGSELALAWGVAAIVLGLTVLRRFYRYWISAVLSTMDITLLAVCMDAGHRYLLAHDRGLVGHQLYASGIVLLTLLAANNLRFSWRLSLWSVAYGAAAYWFVLWLNHAVDVLTYVELIAFGLLGGVLYFSSRKLGSIVRQVVERDALMRFLPAAVVARISREPGVVSLPSEAQEVTALFVDLCGFTSLAEAMEPEAITRMLNEFFTEMAAEVISHSGIPIQYTGDNLYAVFPETSGPDHAHRALLAGLGMLRRLERINERRRSQGLPALGAGVGVHTGTVVAGPIGSPQLLQYTYLGDTVNTASRIERMTREVGRMLLCSGTTLQHAGGLAAFRAEALGDAPLRGKREPLRLWSVSAVRAGPRPDWP